jgi:small subunit ribosomal protein S17
MNEQTEKSPRLVVGRVVSDKMNKTVTVLVERRERHPLYGKYMRRSSRIKAHDENNECHEGDLVAITQCRPLARDKHFRLVEILEKARAVEARTPEA